MCTITNEGYIRQTEILKKQNKPIYAYKVLEVNAIQGRFGKQLHKWGVRLGSPCWKHIWKFGANHSNRLKTGLEMNERSSSEISFGIHAFLNEEYAKTYSEKWRKGSYPSY